MRGSGRGGGRQRVTPDENKLLVVELNEKEIFQAIKGSYAKGSLALMVSLSYSITSFGPPSRKISWL
jgi:hypothetical protein